MNKYMLTTAISCLMLASTLSFANNIQPHPIFKTIDIYEYSLQRSSVSNLLSQDLKLEQMLLLESARDQAEAGNIRTAQEMLTRIAKSIYSISKNTASTTRLNYRDSRKLESLLDAVSSIYAQARQISIEKNSGDEALAKIMSNYDNALIALETGDEQKAKSFIEVSYADLKNLVVALRSGDWLVLSLPDPDTRAGWQDAATRYQDWRFYNSHLITQMDTDRQVIARVEAANSRADHFYKQALEISMQGDWKKAVEKVDLAYRELEILWKSFGIDIGV